MGSKEQLEKKIMELVHTLNGERLKAAYLFLIRLARSTWE